MDGVEDRPFVTESHHKNHNFKNGDFIIVKNAPYLPVFPLSKGKTVTTRKMMFMYWKDAASNEAKVAQMRPKRQMRPKMAQMKMPRKCVWNLHAKLYFRSKIMMKISVITFLPVGAKYQ